MMKLSIALALATALSVGCGKKDACTTTFNKISDSELAEGKAEFAKLKPEEQKVAKAELDKAIKENDVTTARLIKVCQDTKWSEDVLKCLGDAKDNPARSGCMDKLTAEQTGAMTKLMGGDKMEKPPAHDDKHADKPAAGSAEGSAAAGSAAPTGDHAAAPAGLPQECADYKAAVESMMKCDKMAAARDAMKQGFDAMSQGWSEMANMPPEAQKAMADGCKQGTDALKQAMTASGC